MNNREVCEYISTVEPHKNNEGKEYISDLCVKEGYGQTCGGYLKDCEKKGMKSAEPSQKEHFLDYYGDKGEKSPTYYFLRCPQLLLFIAEIAGLSSERLENAFEILKAYENSENLRNKEKNGNYIWERQVFRDFKSQMCISDVVRIIRKAKDWDGVKDKVKEL
ncbi:MAG: hypothetical protein LKI34_04860 [Bifidobacterium tibiigranuli]|jgi:hypothetical protein|uniref:hypothetical protein n=1 Tax=Bifidobacterium tibiigranuli TaxID=2172043 RepID=UPI0026EF86DC|nr:hypothetical protein [Bifidobacterium tibiigranuli]MCI1673529.1 hypothetical protein [Bifidobacterium tibiigranuli]MCI1713876.1 hypothetical protein [Bifidobacterium tibiigranuli]